MHNLQWYDYIRLLASALAFVALYISCRALMIAWPQMTDRSQKIWLLFELYIFIEFESQFELVLEDSRWGARTLLNFLAALFTAIIIWQDRKTIGLEGSSRR